MHLRIQSISKEFDRFPAVHEVSLDIRSGELIALLGPSGSGKTTLLRLIAGLESPSGGRILFGEEDALQRSVQDRGVGFVFQHYALFRHMTVLDNVSFGLKVRPKALRPTAAEIRRRALELLDLVQLPGLAHRYPAQLSGGQRQRVALARAMAIEPKVLLLDEPFGALDAQVRKDLRRWLREIHEQTGYTTVFVTHDQEEALELADRVVVMCRGRVEQVGTPDEVYDQPATPFVHGFIGEASQLPVRVAGGQIRFDNRPTGLLAGGTGGGTLFFRPHRVEIVQHGGAAALRGTTLASRRVSGTRRVELELELGGGSHRVEIEVPVDHDTKPGVEIAFRPTVWRLFPDSGSAVASPVKEPAFRGFPVKAEPAAAMI